MYQVSLRTSSPSKAYGPNLLRRSRKRQQARREGARPIFVFLRRATTLSRLDHFIPRSRFASSVYTTPMLFLFRLFLPAAPFDTVTAAALATSASGHELTRIFLETGWLKKLSDQKWQQERPSYTDESNIRPTKQNHALFSDSQTPLVAWAAEILEVSPERYQHFRVVSVTWVKALASHLSHEYLQFVVEEEYPDAGTMEIRPKRHRLIADRHECGDSIFAGIDWSHGEGPGKSHKLPLPLVSVVFHDRRHRPSLAQFAALMAATSTAFPEYDAMKRMCWWFCEVVIEQAWRLGLNHDAEVGRTFSSSFSPALPPPSSQATLYRGKDVIDMDLQGKGVDEGGKVGGGEEEEEEEEGEEDGGKRGTELRQWQYAHLRYALVLRSNTIIPRRRLTEHAEAFKRLNREEIMF